MTKQEVREEFKQSEGDPLIKSRIKRIQMEMARKRMMQAVPNADVVITNPTHFAVALKYDSAAMVAPQVVAKGRGFIALKIIAVAQEAGVPRVENRYVVVAWPNALAATTRSLTSSQIPLTRRKRRNVACGVGSSGRAGRMVVTKVMDVPRRITLVVPEFVGRRSAIWRTTTRVVGLVTAARSGAPRKTAR